VSVDPSITVVQLSPSIILSVNVNASAGRSFRASFDLLQTMSLPAVANAFTQNGTSANDNFGGLNYLYVKDDATSYYRQAYLMFNLSSVPGTISNANLMLASKSLGQTSAMANDIYLVPNNSWTESTLTWNNRTCSQRLCVLGRHQRRAKRAEQRHADIVLHTIAHQLRLQRLGSVWFAREHQSGTATGFTDYLLLTAKQ
jgi:hypothetical protein